ncbi:MAG: replication factor C large subunit [Candidatus Woesearchaeota archaeon]|nr:replication factor C large subunit [Candidatus Woesearchaeota archaeon]
MALFTQKYAPKKNSDIVGQDHAIAQVQLFIKNFKQQKHRCLILHGPAGCGKTSIAHVVAHGENLELVELNASDVRNKEGISSVLGGALKQQSLFFRGKIILLDDIDGISGSGDRGGVAALLSLLETSSFPVICTAIDPFADNLKPLRKASTLVACALLDYASISSLLTTICAAEKITADPVALRTLARHAGGDARAALNDLYTLTGGTHTLTAAEVAGLDAREQLESIPNALLKVFKTKQLDIALHAFDLVDEEPDQILSWIQENLPHEYNRPADLARAYDYLSKADIMRRRIRRWQYWRFLVYVSAYMTGGVAVSKDEKNHAFITYKQTMRGLMIWQANMKYTKRKSIAEKLAPALHTSSKNVVNNVIPYLQGMFRNTTPRSTPMTAQIATEYELDDDEVAWLKGK